MDPFLGEIIMFAGNFAPRGWALCDGQLLPINQNTALFSILGTTYGGDGRTNFALPDLRGRAPIHAGNGPGLTPARLGQKGGAETNMITIAHMPSHNHEVSFRVGGDADTDDPINAFISPAEEDSFSATATTNTMGAAAASNTGGGQAINNMQPYGVVNYIIALQGTFPSRN